MPGRSTLSWMLIVLSSAAALAAAGAVPDEARAMSQRTTRIYLDAVGDVSCCTRDISRVAISNDDAGRITFAITASGEQTGEDGDDDDLVIRLHTDRNRSTGANGLDYTIAAEIQDGSIHVSDFQGWDPERRRALSLARASVRVSATDDVFRLTVDRHALGDTDAFRFDVAVYEVALGNVYSDAVPEGVFRLKLALGTLRPVVSTPTAVLAGRPLVARLTLHVRGTRARLASGRVVCRAQVGGVRLRLLRSGFSARRAFCRWSLRRTARGKLVRGSIGVFVTSRSSSYVGRPFSSRIR